MVFGVKYHLQHQANAIPSLVMSNNIHGLHTRTHTNSLPILSSGKCVALPCYDNYVIWASWRPKSPATPLLIRELVQADSKGNTLSSYYWLHGRGIHRYSVHSHTRLVTLEVFPYQDVLGCDDLYKLTINPCKWELCRIPRGQWVKWNQFDSCFK